MVNESKGIDGMKVEVEGYSGEAVLYAWKSNMGVPLVANPSFESLRFMGLIVDPSEKELLDDAKAKFKEKRSFCNMWSLVILAFWWMPQSSDAATSVTVPGFSSKATCIEAGEQYIKDAGRYITLKRKSGNGPARYNNTHEESVYYHYQCVEVK